MKLTCKYCKEKIYAEPFIYSPQIITTDNPFTAFDSPRYEAKVNMKFTCTNCGAVNHQVNIRDINEKDIIKLAIGE